MPSLRRARRLAESIISLLPSRVSNGDSLVLAYHNVVRSGECGQGDRSLHLDIESFEAQLRIAGEEADLVSLSDLIDNHGRPGRRLAVSFDDAYKGSIDFGVPLCAAAGIAPTIFVSPSLLGRLTPWDCLAQRSAWSPTDRERFLVAGGIAADFAETANRDNLPESYRIVSLHELKQAVANYRIEIANHTSRHVNLGTVDEAVIIDELAGAESFLTENFGAQLIPNCVAYPYGGLPRRELVRQLAAQINTGFKVTGGWHPRSRSTHDLYVNRQNIPAGISLQRFRAQLRGWLIKDRHR